jgi:hypothetical protein
MGESVPEKIVEAIDRAYECVEHHGDPALAAALKRTAEAIPALIVWMAAGTGPFYRPSPESAEGIRGRS